MPVEEIQKPTLRCSDGKEFTTEDRAAAEAHQAVIDSMDGINSFLEEMVAESVYKGKSISMLKGALSRYEQFKAMRTL